MIHLSFNRGSIVIRGETGTPYGQWDPRIEAYRALALHYPDVKTYLEKSNISYEDEVLNLLPLPLLRSKLRLRSYQEKALRAWISAGRRGVIVLPTGAGKTYIALKAIQKLNEPTLVIVPTIDLVEQWRQKLSQEFYIEVGAIGGGEEQIEPITVSTYDSAVMRAEQLGNRFMLIVFDEVHHLPAPTYSQIAEMYVAPHRMGLTATYERNDGAHNDLSRLMGGRVYELGVHRLVGKHLSPYSYEKVLTELTQAEREEYQRDYTIFSSYIRRSGTRMRSVDDFHRFIMRTGRDPEARRALLARNRALKVVLNSVAKIDTLGSYLRNYREEKSIIFTRLNELVYIVSCRFLIPAVTHMTPREERHEILDRFKAGTYKVIVTSQVLDEGIDVPDASVAFVLSGTGSSREYIQRLGRILRKKEGKEAKLIEFVAKETVETRISERRHRS